MEKKVKNKKNELIIKFLNVFLGILVFITYIVLYNDYIKNGIINADIIKFIFSWCGIIVYVYILITWYKQKGKILDLYTIIITFLFLFNYGQCFLWAFNIHENTEIGLGNSYGIGNFNDTEIIISQIISITSIFMFHVGSSFCQKFNKSNKIENKKNHLKSIYDVSKILSIVVVPVTLFKLFLEFKISAQYGYSSLYYGDIATTGIVTEMINRLFYPCIFGLMIGSNFNSKINKIVLGIMLIYFSLSLASGDRGAWAYAILIFIFIYNEYIKKIGLMGFIKLTVLGIVLLNMVTAIVSVRNTGISFESVSEALKIKNNPIIKTIAEMGGSMQVQTTLVRNGYDIYPYGNTHIFAFLGIISDKVIKFLGINYVNLSDWFSQEYLGLNDWGAGFSIVGENLINYGPYGAPIAMLVIGYIFTSLIYLSEEDLKNNPKRVLFALISCISLICIFRGTIAYNLKIYMYMLIVFMGLIKIYYLYSKSLQKKEGIK